MLFLYNVTIQQLISSGLMIDDWESRKECGVQDNKTEHTMPPCGQHVTLQADIHDLVLKRKDRPTKNIRLAQ
jgi:hypothetical protein